jgi:hypothetical protein
MVEGTPFAGALICMRWIRCACACLLAPKAVRRAWRNGWPGHLGSAVMHAIAPSGGNPNPKSQSWGLANLNRFTHRVEVGY